MNRKHKIIVLKLQWHEAEELCCVCKSLPTMLLKLGSTLRHFNIAIDQECRFVCAFIQFFHRFALSMTSIDERTNKNCVNKARQTMMKNRKSYDVKASLHTILNSHRAVCKQARWLVSLWDMIFRWHRMRLAKQSSYSRLLLQRAGLFLLYTPLPLCWALA